MHEQEKSFESGRFPISFKKKEIGRTQQKANWQQIEQNLSKRIQPKWWYYAAAAALIPALVLVYVIFSNPMVKYHTQYGEILKIELPDQTIVHLNGNSELKVPKKWDNHAHRSVYLKGEAYFEVQPVQATAVKFTVHLQNLDVEVLGTKFNVNELPNNTRVSLKEGKVMVYQVSKLKQRCNETPLEPGFEYKIERNENRSVREIDPNIVADWRNHRYHFDQTTMAEVMDMVKVKFGYDVVVQDTAILNRKISGDLKATDVKQFAWALAVTMNIDIEIENEKLIFKSI
jgi:transmembrane sensor